MKLPAGGIFKNALHPMTVAKHVKGSSMTLSTSNTPLVLDIGSLLFAGRFHYPGKPKAEYQLIDGLAVTPLNRLLRSLVRTLSCSNNCLALTSPKGSLSSRINWPSATNDK